MSQSQDYTPSITASPVFCSLFSSHLCQILLAEPWVLSSHVAPRLGKSLQGRSALDGQGSWLLCIEYFGGSLDITGDEARSMGWGQFREF